jgi:hypothetical protein
MNKSYLLALCITTGFYSQINFAESITDTYTTGDTLTATKLNNIKSAVNNNDARITSNASNIATNAGDISSILSRFPVLLPTYMLSRPPTKDDDWDSSDVPFPRGTIVVDTVSKQAYISADDTRGAAVWLSLTQKTYKIGDDGPAGGVVFYTTDGGMHGLEAELTDRPINQYGCVGTPIAAPTSRLVGSGERNTNAIVFGCAEQSAARDIYNHTTSSGYNDWFLPSIDELSLLYAAAEAGVVDGFSDDFYWSSTEDYNPLSGNAYTCLFNINAYGCDTVSSKDVPLHVRAIRAF